METSNTLHFSSPSTGASMLLPIGWEEKDNGDDYVIYYNDRDGEELDPQIFIKKIILPQIFDSIEIKLLEDFLNIERKNFEFFDGGSMEIDGKTAAYAEFQYLEENSSEMVYCLQLYLNCGLKILSFTSISQLKNMNIWAEDFKLMVNSIRDIK